MEILQFSTKPSTSFYWTSLDTVQMPSEIEFPWFFYGKDFFTCDDDNVNDYDNYNSNNDNNDNSNNKSDNDK